MTGEGGTVEEVDRLLDVITLDRIEQSSQDLTSGKFSSLTIAELLPADCPVTPRRERMQAGHRDVVETPIK